MSIENKKMMSIVVYYTLAILAIASAGFFIYALVVKDVVMWAKIVYFVWAGFVIGTVIFDLYCTSTGENKYASAWMVYILSILAVAMACILYFLNTTSTGLLADFLPLFTSVSILSLMTSGYLIATWCVGESLVEHNVSEREINDRQRNA